MGEKTGTAGPSEPARQTTGIAHPVSFHNVLRQRDHHQ